MVIVYAVIIVNMQAADSLFTHGFYHIIGAAAHKAGVGDLIIIAAYAQMTPEEAREWHPTVIFPKDNRL